MRGDLDILLYGHGHSPLILEQDWAGSLQETA